MSLWLALAIAVLVFVLLALTLAIEWRERSLDRREGRAKFLERRRESMGRVRREIGSGEERDAQR